MSVNSFCFVANNMPIKKHFSPAPPSKCLSEVLILKLTHLHHFYFLDLISSRPSIRYTKANLQRLRLHKRGIVIREALPCLPYFSAGSQKKIELVPCQQNATCIELSLQSRKVSRIVSEMLTKSLHTGFSLTFSLNAHVLHVNLMASY